MLFVAPPALGALPNPDWYADDPKGDVAVEGTSAATDSLPHLDLLKLSIDSENVGGLFLTIEVEDLIVDPGAFGNSEAVSYTVDWLIAGMSDTFRLKITLEGVLLNGTSTFVAKGLRDEYWGSGLCIGSIDYSCRLQRVSVTLDGATDVIRTWIPKESLHGQNPYGGSYGGPSPPSRNLTLGDEMQTFVVKTTKDLIGGKLSDTLTKDTPGYVFKHGFANQALQLKLVNVDEVLPLAIGVNQTISFVLKNTANRKQLVRLDYIIPDDAGGVVSVYGPPSVAISALGTRNFTIAIEIDEIATPSVMIPFRIEGVTTGGDIGQDAALLRPATSLSPDHPILYVQARSKSDSTTAACNSGYSWYLPSSTKCPTGFLSARRDVPGTVPDGDIPFSNYGEINLDVDEALTGPVAIAVAGRAEVDLNIASPAKFDGTEARVNIQYKLPGAEISRTLATLTKNFDLESPKTLVKLSGRVLVPAADYILPRGTQIRFEIHVTTGTVGYANQYLREIRLVAADSQARIPLAPLPDDLNGIARLTPFQIGTVGSEDHQFVNPGKARLWNVTVTNQDVQKQVLEMDARLDGSGQEWEFEFLPAAKYDLNPGDTVQIGFRVRIPTEARENDASFIRVLAMADDGTNATKLVSVLVVSERTLPQPDDSGVYKADPDDAEKAVHTPKAKNTPLPSLTGSLAALGLALALRRRKP